MAPDKIERQLGALHDGDNKRLLLSSPWAPFYYRTKHARFVRNSLWQDLSPTEWLLRKLGENLHMQNATWLVSREVTEASGPWDESLQYDRDGEYFARVLLASDGTRFVPETGIFYRASPSNRVSYLGNSSIKKDSLFRSMKPHIRYLRSLEDSERVRKACIFHMQIWYAAFYPERQDILAELEAIAAELQGHPTVPRLNWKYNWIQPLLGWRTTKLLQSRLGEFKSLFARQYGEAMFRLQGRRFGEHLRV